jgi:hypothetical protein
LVRVIWRCRARLFPGVPTEALGRLLNNFVQNVRAETPLEAKQRSRQRFQISAKTSGGLTSGPATLA